MGLIAYEFRVEMSRALYESYLAILTAGECRTQFEAIERARKSPAPHFFTSARNCCYVLTKMANGEPTGLSNPDKVRKFKELDRRAREYRETHTEWPGLMNVSRIIVNEPAPEYYICYSTAKQMILSERKKRQEEVARKWAKR